MKPISTTKAIALIFVAYWLTTWAYLPPFAPKPNVDSLIAMAGAPPEAAENMWREINTMYAIGFAMIALGAISGGLLFFKRRSGHILTLGLSIVILCSSLYSWFSKEAPIERFQLFIEYFPARAIHLDIVGNLVFVSTILILTRKSIWSVSGGNRI